MVLTSLGDDRSEKEIARILGSYEYGTPASRVSRLKRKGYQVLFGSFTFDHLKRHLNAGLFPIVFVRADMLPWANFAGFHALVMANISELMLPYSIQLRILALPAYQLRGFSWPGKNSTLWPQLSQKIDCLNNVSLSL